TREHRVVEAVAVVVRMQADAGHAMLLVTAAQVFLPVGLARVDRAKGDEEAGIALALIREPSIDTGQVLVQHALEAAGPRLRNLDATQLLHNVGGLKPGRAPK